MQMLAVPNWFWVRFASTIVTYLTPTDGQLTPLRLNPHGDAPVQFELVVNVVALETPSSAWIVTVSPALAPAIWPYTLTRRVFVVQIPLFLCVRVEASTVTYATGRF